MIDGRPIQRSDISIAHKKLEEMSDEELAARMRWRRKSVPH